MSHRHEFYRVVAFGWATSWRFACGIKVRRREDAELLEGK